MAKKLTLHVQQNTTLERVAVIVEFLGSKKTDLAELAASCGLGLSVLQKNVFPFLRNLGIIDKKTPPSLTDLGKKISFVQRTDPSLLGDLLHLIIYQLHLEKPEKRFSWAYATVAQQLWWRKEVVLSPAEKKSLVGVAIDLATQNFELSQQQIAFSESSISGILNWLRPLSPTVLELNGKFENFNRRYFCAAPILLEATDILYKQLARTYGVKIFLKENVLDSLCQMLLLDPSGLDNCLDNAKLTYDYDEGGLFDWGYEGGYGQWIMLVKSPEWNQLL
jgi:hypothetical protein